MCILTVNSKTTGIVEVFILYEYNNKQDREITLQERGRESPEFKVGKRSRCLRSRGDRSNQREKKGKDIVQYVKGYNCLTVVIKHLQFVRKVQYNTRGVPILSTEYTEIIRNRVSIRVTLLFTMDELTIKPKCIWERKNRKRVAFIFSKEVSDTNLKSVFSNKIKTLYICH